MRLAIVLACLPVLVMTVFRPTSAAAPASPDAAAQSLAEANNRFAWDLYAQLVQESDGNLFFSPQSISIALAMTYDGARGDTATQMAKVLHLGMPQNQTPEAFAALLTHLNADQAGGAKRPYELSIANRLWGQQGHKFLDPFLATMREDYDAELGIVDFVHQTEQSRQTINNWVAKETNDKIQDLIPAGALDDMTRLVLTNAIYFKGTWARQFNKDLTRPMEFHLASGQKAEVPMMYQKSRFKFAKHADVSLLELPYKGNELSMLAILPAKIDGLAEIEKQLSPEKLAEWTARMAQPEVMVWLPRFKTTSEFQLNAMLARLGMPLAFAPGSADFSGMDGTHDLYISAALHKAFVDVNEEGTEAAAATGIVAGVTSMPVDPPMFRADHPFVFVIRDNATGSILFVGRVTDPRS